MSVALVGDQEVGTINGVVMGDQAQLEISSGGAHLTYVITPTERWT